jgi:hypothetical protein
MKFNQWTIGLASLGLVSLSSAARAEDQVNMVQTALASTMISGYVDTSAQWNLGTGNDRLPDYKFGGTSKADGFNLNVIQLRIEKPLDEQDWAAGYRVDLWAGPDANTLGTQSVNHELGTSSDFAVRQAYIALRMPVLNGIDWKIGVFDSIVGYESVESPSNPNYTRSYGHSIEPQTHTGFLVSYRFTDMIAVSAGIANTKGPSINARAFGEDGRAESSKTYMASISLSAPDNVGFLSGSTLYGGVVSGLDENENRSDYDGNSRSWYAGATLATPVAGLRLGGAFDFLDVSDTRGETWSLAGYASFQATEKLSLHGRAEYLRDRGDQKFFAATVVDPTDPTSTVAIKTNPDRVLALTATAQYDLWKNVISRLELRWDHSLTGEGVWGTEGANGMGTLRNEVMLAANLIYKF